MPGIEENTCICRGATENAEKGTDSAGGTLVRRGDIKSAPPRNALILQRTHTARPLFKKFLRYHSQCPCEDRYRLMITARVGRDSMPTLSEATFSRCYPFYALWVIGFTLTRTASNANASGQKRPAGRGGERRVKCRSWPPPTPGCLFKATQRRPCPSVWDQGTAPASSAASLTRLSSSCSI